MWQWPLHCTFYEQSMHQMSDFCWQFSSFRFLWFVKIVYWREKDIVQNNSQNKLLFWKLCKSTWFPDKNSRFCKTHQYRVGGINSRLLTAKIIEERFFLAKCLLRIANQVLRCVETIFKRPIVKLQLSSQSDSQNWVFSWQWNCVRLHLRIACRKAGYEVCLRYIKFTCKWLYLDLHGKQFTQIARELPACRFIWFWWIF